MVRAKGQQLDGISQGRRIDGTKKVDQRSWQVLIIHIVIDNISDDLLMSMRIFWELRYDYEF